MSRRLAAKEFTPEQKAQAAACLEWLAEQVERVKGQSQLDQAAWRMEFEFELACVLFGISKIVTTVKNGKTVRSIESAR